MTIARAPHTRVSREVGSPPSRPPVPYRDLDAMRAAILSGENGYLRFLTKASELGFLAALRRYENHPMEMARK